MTIDKDWWRGAVMYQIYPRSYKDSNADGIGDLNGITDKLDYVASLGVDGIWISPFYQSPMKDFGYDVSNYKDVDPMFGNLGDFDQLIEKARRLNLKVIIDMVLSHSSDQHPWFAESRQNKHNAHADWYIWADPKPDGTPPNNWQSVFGGPAWTFDTRRGQYYMHNFLKEQPDLNFHHPAVQEALLDACRFWLERGIDGFRLDTVNFYVHDKELRDNPPRDHSKVSTGVQVESPYPYIMQQHIYDKSRPENLDFLRRLRTLMDQYGAQMTLGEIGDDDPYKLAVEYTTGTDLLHTTYNTHMLAGTHGTLLEKRLIDLPQREFLKHGGGGWPSWAFCNHDVVRVVTRWGKDVPYYKQNDFAKMLTALLCSLRGTIFLYQGEELGLPEAQIPYERIQDPWGKYLWPEWQGRDGCRTPMPWQKLEHEAGFSTAPESWLPIPDVHREHAVDQQDHDPDSILNFTRRFLHWRKSKPALIKGDITFIDTDDEALFVFERRAGNEVVRCTFNLGPEAIGELDGYAYRID